MTAVSPQILFPSVVVKTGILDLNRLDGSEVSILVRERRLTVNTSSTSDGFPGKVSLVISKGNTPITGVTGVPFKEGKDVVFPIISISSQG